MADEEDLRLLHEGKKDLSTCDFRAANLEGVNLRDRDLTGTLFNNADLTSADLRGANLSGTQFTQANLTGANLENSILNRAQLIFTNLSGANLKGARFSRERGQGPTLHNVNLNGADLRGAHFQGVGFNEACTFDGVVVDATTDFEGARMLRAASRNPAFAAYYFDKGSLHLRPQDGSPPETEPTRTAEQETVTPETPPIETPQLDRDTSSHNIVLATPKNVQILTAGLQTRIAAEITFLEGHKPNEPAALDVYSRYIDLLTHIIDQLSTITNLLEDIQGADSSSDKSVAAAQAEKSLRQMGEEVLAWTTKNFTETIKFGVNAGTLALTLPYLISLGVNPNLCFAAAAAMLGGDKVVEAFKAIASTKRED